jgi:hypothetical protein
MANCPWPQGSVDRETQSEKGMIVQAEAGRISTTLIDPSPSDRKYHAVCASSDDPYGLHRSCSSVCHRMPCFGQAEGHTALHNGR